MDIKALKCNIHNKFDIEVIDGKTGEVKEKAEAYNMVLDNLWHYIIETTTAFGTAIQYGSGTGTISASDTSLFNRANGINVTQDSLDCDYTNKVITRRCHINLGLTTSVGVNITEVGLAAGTGNGSLTTHAILQDMNGNIINITKTEFDIINIYATIYCHWTIVDPSINIAFSNALQQSLTGQNNIFGNFTGGVGVNNYYVITSKTWSKTSSDLANKRITYTLPRFSQSEGNGAGGILTIIGSGNYDGVSLKQGSNTWSSYSIINESVGTGDGIQTNFNTKFHCPKNASIYVNGILQSSSDVSVLEIPVGYPDVNTDGMPLLYIDINRSTANNPVIKPTSSFGSYNTDHYFYNPYYNNGSKVDSFYFSQRYQYSGTIIIDGSNDLENWTNIDTFSNWDIIGGTGALNGYRHLTSTYISNYKFYKLRMNISGSSGNYLQKGVLYTTQSNIVFNTPPADGDVITVDYTTDYIPKDSDHVMDASITFKFGDYVPTL